MHGEPFRAPADLGRRRQQSLGEEVSQALASADLFHHLDHRIGVAEAQVDPSGILQGEQAVLKALHRKRNRHPGADRVQRIGVAELVGSGYGHDVTHPAGRAQRADGLVLGAPIVRIDGVRFLGLDDLFAAHGAGPAALHADADLVHDEFQAVDLGELAVAKVAHGQVPRDDPTLELAAAGAPLGQARGSFACSDLLSGAARHGPDRLGIGALHVGRAPGDHRFQLLGAHHRPDAAASGGILEAVHHAGIAHHVFPTWADHGQLGAALAQLLANGLLGLLDGLAPEARRIADLAGAVGDPQVDRSLGRPLDDQRVEPRALELGAPVTAHLRRAERAGQGRLGPDGVAGSARDRQAGQHARGKDEHVLRPQRVGPCGHLPEQDIGDQVPASHVTPQVDDAGLLYADHTLGQVDPQDLVVKRLRHLWSSFECPPSCARGSVIPAWRSGAPGRYSACAVFT